MTERAVQITGPIETTACDFESVESVNDNLFQELHNLVRTPFFKFWRVRRSIHERLERMSHPSTGPVEP
jgi:hypothetical protein